jgi:hypothetical protein
MFESQVAVLRRNAQNGRSLVLNNNKLDVAFENP